MFRGLEHPSGFPSMLRGSTPEPKPLSRRDSYGSSHQLRRDSNEYRSSTPTALGRRDNSSPNVLMRKDSNGSVLSRKDSSEFKSNKRDSLNDDFRRLSFGNSIYLRPDSTGTTNLIRRDSFGRRESTKSPRIPRDYVSQIFELKTDSSVIENGNGNALPDKDAIANISILRKPDDAQTNKENLNSDLTAANITKHVTIWEKDGDDGLNGDNHTSARRDSSGSLGNYSRRISLDSIDVRRNSRRGSSTSGDINFNSINHTSEEVNFQQLTIVQLIILTTNQRLCELKIGYSRFYHQI